MNSGTVLACTGVMLAKPMLSTASRIHGDRFGVSASQALDFVDFRNFGACAMVLPLDSPGLLSKCFKIFLRQNNKK